MRILLSNESSKLCFRQTKTVLSDRNCALQRSAETLLRSRNSRRKEVQIQNQTDGEDNTNNLNLKYPPPKKKRPSQVYFETAPLLVSTLLFGISKTGFFCCVIVVNPSAAMSLATSLAVLLTRSMP